MSENQLQQRFGKKYVFLPVIHVVDLEQARHNATIAMANGADGVFLINHEMEGDRPVSAQDLLSFRKTIQTELPDAWIGVNCLELSTFDQFSTVQNDADGIWSDNAHVDDTVKGRAEASRVNT